VKAEPSATALHVSLEGLLLCARRKAVEPDDELLLEVLIIHVRPVARAQIIRNYVSHAALCAGLAATDFTGLAALGRHNPSLFGGMPHHIDMAIETLHLTVRGMTCGNCARGVERKLAGTAGVTRAVVDLNGAAATVEYDAAQVKPEALAEAVRELGYEVPA
jgi:copper chaperone